MYFCDGVEYNIKYIKIGPGNFKRTESSAVSKLGTVSQLPKKDGRKMKENFIIGQNHKIT